MRIQESGEMYLETIYVLSSQKNSVRAIDICEHMGYSKPSVSRAMRILKNEELIDIGSSGHITLTDKGKSIAQSMYERHTLIARFLESIGVDSAVASDDACRIEHCISEQSFEAIKKFAERSADNRSLL